MNAAMLTTAPTRCPHCNGQMYREQSDEFCCLSCGEYVFANAAAPASARGRRSARAPR